MLLYSKIKLFDLCLVPICCWHTWDNIAAYVNIYRWIVMCPRHWLPACLRSWTEFNLTDKLAVASDYQRTSSADAKYSSKMIWSISSGGMVEIATIRSLFAQIWVRFEVHRRCARDPLEEIANHCQLQLATTSLLGWRDMRTRLKFPQLLSRLS